MAVSSRTVIFEIETDLDNYQVIEEIYTGRPSRVLYGGKYKTAQSGMPLDNLDEMLFEYNQRLVELINQLKPKEVLAIGGGAFTLPTYITSKDNKIHFDIVEPDKKLESIAAKYFNFARGDNIKVINDYGLHYLKKNKKKYDLIIVDAYLDNEIPEEIMSKKFAKLAESSLANNGVLVANVISDTSLNSSMDRMHSSLNKYLKHSKVYPAGPERIYYYPTNFIYVTSNSPIDFKLRHPELSLRGFSS